MSTAIIKVRKLIFETGINPRQIDKFRGAIIEKANSPNVLFHNHVGDGFLRKYPLIQYKILEGKAGILALNEGCMALNDLLNNYNYQLNFDKETHNDLLFTDTTIPFKFGIDSKLHKYYMANWVPFNSEALKDFEQLETMEEKIAKLHSLLVKNLVNMSTRMGINTKHPYNRIEVDIENIKSDGTMRMHTTPLQKFKVRFKTNVLLPPDIGLGRATAFGAGCVKVGW